MTEITSNTDLNTLTVGYESQGRHASPHQEELHFQDGQSQKFSPRGIPTITDCHNLTNTEPGGFDGDVGEEDLFAGVVTQRQQYASDGFHENSQFSVNHQYSFA